MIFRFLLITFLLFSKISYAQDESGCSNVYSYLIFNADNNNILSETRSEKISYPASLVKLMTLYLTFEALQKGKIHLNQIIEVSERGEEISEVNKINTLHLKAGDKIMVKQAIYGTIVKSFNEMALSLAEAVSGNEWEFVRKMNEKAFELGMFDTSFRNATGLHEEGQYTTSYDLARLVIALRHDFPQYYPFFALKEFQYGDRKYETHNHVLTEYNGAEGMKTGFTNASGYNLISSAKKSNDRVVSILLGCSTSGSRDLFTKELLDKSFSDLRDKKDGSILSKIVQKFNYKTKVKNRDYEEDKRFKR